jgi:hypothetical protein
LLLKHHLVQAFIDIAAPVELLLKLRFVELSRLSSATPSDQTRSASYVVGTAVGVDGGERVWLQGGYWCEDLLVGLLLWDEGLRVVRLLDLLIGRRRTGVVELGLCKLDLLRAH